MKPCALTILAMLLPVSCTGIATSQCTNAITAVPLTTAAKRPRIGRFVRFTYHLTSGDLLQVVAKGRSDDTLGPFDQSITISRSGKQVITSGWLGENKRVMSITRVCKGDRPLFIAAVGVEGDELSAVAFLVFSQVESSIVMARIPPVSGGVLELSASNPKIVQTWDNLHEGSCNACETHYRIRSYLIAGDRAIRMKRFTTRHLYDSSDPRFDDRLRVRILAGE